MIFSDNGFNLLKQVEGCKLEAYIDQGGKWTIGYGSTSNVSDGMLIDQQEAGTRLHASVAQIVNLINNTIKVVLCQNQFDALVLFIYNVGQHAFESSSMLRYINNGSYLAASEEFKKWNHIAGQVNAGLTNRRELERKLFVTL